MPPPSGHEKAFKKHLAQQLPPLRTHCNADCHLSLPCHTAGQQQVRDICAGDGEHEQDGNGEHCKEFDHHRADPWGQGTGRRQQEAVALVGGGICLGVMTSERLQLSGRRSRRDAGLETADDVEPMNASVRLAVDFRGIVALRGKLRDVPQRHPELGIEDDIEPMVSRWSDTDDGVGMTGNPYDFANDLRIGGEEALPQPISKNDDLSVFFIRSKAAAD